jgi:hypothetical protein
MIEHIDSRHQQPCRSALTQSRHGSARPNSDPNGNQRIEIFIGSAATCRNIRWFRGSTERDLCVIKPTLTERIDVVEREDRYRVILLRLKDCGSRMMRTESAAAAVGPFRSGGGLR